jgi:hypothetical protein
VDSYEKLDCTRISNARDLRGTVSFFASEESVTGLDEEKSKFPYFSFPLRVGSDGAAKTIRLSEFLRAQRSIHRLRVKGPDKQVQIVFAKNRRFLIALYFSHLSVFSYENLTLCKEPFIFLEYPKNFEACCR